MTTQSALQTLLEESIRLELQVSALYLMYSTRFPQDKDFWWRMSMEEKNHAAILKSGKLYLSVNKLPDSAVFDDPMRIKAVADMISARIDEFTQTPPTMQVAYGFALTLEREATELHYQDMITTESTEKVIKIFQELNNEDQDHAKRIQDLMESNRLAIPEAD